jgi:hypothetical protein
MKKLIIAILKAILQPGKNQIRSKPIAGTQAGKNATGEQF